MQIIKSKKEKVKGYACAPSVLAGAAAMGVMVVALFVVLWYNGFLTEPLILVTAGPMNRTNLCGQHKKPPYAGI